MNAPSQNYPQIAAPITDHDFLIIAGASRVIAGASRASTTSFVAPAPLTLALRSSCPTPR
jgi:hypothetical protein